MKKFQALFLLVVLSSLATWAADSEKEYKKLISKIDVAEEAKTLPDNSPAEFWKSAIDNNETFAKFLRDIQKGKGAEKEAIQKTNVLPHFYPQYDESIVESMQGFCDTLLMDMGIDRLDYKCSLHIVYADEAAAFTALTEDGFAMCLTSRLLDKKGMSYNILMGYVAHEFAHGALLHHIRGFYTEAKERRKSDIWGGIAIGLSAVAEGLETYNNVTYGIPPTNDDVVVVIEDSKETKLCTSKYVYGYTAEQEFEADLVAFRFMQNLGLSDDFLNGLRILGADYDKLYDDFDNHPTISSRITFLNFAQAHPELGNKQNPKLKKKRLRAEEEL